MMMKSGKNPEQLAADILRKLIDSFQNSFALDENKINVRIAIAKQIRDSLKLPPKNKDEKSERQAQITSMWDLKSHYSIEIPSETKLRLQECNRNLRELIDSIEDHSKSFKAEV